MKRVNIEEIFELANKVKLINQLNLEEIELFENGEKIDIPGDVLESWKYIGLNNMDFFTSRYYRVEQTQGHKRIS